MKKIGKRSIWISIVVATMLLTGCGNQTGSADQATGSDAADFSGLTTEVAEVTTEEATTEAALEVVSNEDSRPEAVPTSTIGGGKKKAGETIEEKKPSNSSNSGSGHNSTSSNSGSAISNGSNGNSNSSGNNNSNNSNSGNSGSSNSGNSGSNNSANSGSNNGGNSNSANKNNAANNTPQHQHNYNVWVKTKDAYDEKVIDQAAYDETIEHPEEGYWADAVQCRMCGQVFTSAAALDAHPCGDQNYGTANDVWVKTKDAWTETKHHDEKSHVVHHDEEGYWKCECGARK